jgi:hypothetical protein
VRGLSVDVDALSDTARKLDHIHEDAESWKKHAIAAWMRTAARRPVLG